jgi:large subunit ribosomal protein L18
MKSKQERYEYRRERTRRKLAVNLERPRLSVHKSGRHLYAQVVDDLSSTTVASASSLSKEIKEKAKSGKNLDTAKQVGGLVAKRALEKGVKKVRFDRGASVYHGRIRAVADAAREAGLEF